MQDLLLARSDVKLVRWPFEAARRDQYRRAGVPCLLVVEAGAKPPVCTDPCEDWVRAPISKVDLEARLAALEATARSLRLPQVDPSGMIRCGSRSVTLSPSETDLLTLLVDNYGSLTTREELGECISDRSEAARRNALHLHIMRIRRRIRPLGLVIRTVWGRGYLLEAASEFGEDMPGDVALRAS